MTRNKALDPLVTTFGRLLEATHHLEDRLGRDLEASCDLPLTWFEVLLPDGAHKYGLVKDIAGRTDTLFSGDAVTVIHNAARGYPRRGRAPDRQRLHCGRLRRAVGEEPRERGNLPGRMHLHRQMGRQHLVGPGNGHGF